MSGNGSVESFEGSLKLAVILPSRGLWFSAAAMTWIREWNAWMEHGHMYGVFACHDQPMPECHNIPLLEMCAVEQDNDFRFDLVWWLEDDIVLPENILPEMIRRLGEARMKDERIVGIVPQTWSWRAWQAGGTAVQSTTVGADGFVEGTGLFCLLQTRDVLDEFEMPLFSPMNRYQDGNRVRDLFGSMGQDWRYQIALRQKGYRMLAATDLEVGHLKIRSVKDVDGGRWTWNGIHDIFDQRSPP